VLLGGRPAWTDEIGWGLLRRQAPVPQALAPSLVRPASLLVLQVGDTKVQILSRVMLAGADGQPARKENQVADATDTHVDVTDKTGDAIEKNAE
jgi:hypothetical protein